MIIITQTFTFQGQNVFPSVVTLTTLWFAWMGVRPLMQEVAVVEGRHRWTTGEDLAVCPHFIRSQLVGAIQVTVNLREYGPCTRWVPYNTHQLLCD